MDTQLLIRLYQAINASEQQHESLFVTWMK